MNSASDARIVNVALEQFYSGKLEPWKLLRIEQAKSGHCLSIPFFLKVSSAYLEACPKIVFVGQETHGWWTDYSGDISALTAAQIMDFYETEWSVLYQKYLLSAYWRAMRHSAGAFQLADPPRSFLYSNIFPCDLDRKRTPLVLHDTFRDWKILARELQVLAPDYLIFFCGREYYGNLTAYFGEWPKQFVSTASPLVSYQPTGHKWKGFVTYHPAYLMRSKRWGLLDEIIRLIKIDLDDALKTKT